MEALNILYIDDLSEEFLSFAFACKQCFSLDDEMEPVIFKETVTFLFGNKKIICVKSSKEALKRINNEQFDIVFIDYGLTEEKGDEVGKIIYNYHYNIYKKIIYQVMLTSHNDTLIDTLRAGVFKDFIGKPLNDKAAFAGVFARFETFKILNNANIELEKEKIRTGKEIVKLKSEVQSQQKLIEEFDKKAIAVVSADDRFETLDRSIIGISKGIQRVKYFIKKYAETDDNVLIVGETGTGKDLVAEAIHKLSSRKNEIFKAINCAAIPDDLIESTLFGVIKDYPGFHNKKNASIGAFEEANKGTIFLDEIGRMSLKGQSKLLRLLEEQKVIRLGEIDKEGHKVDVRIIAAIKPNTITEIGCGFLEDLYGRLDSLFPIIPPLNERLEDIPFLVNHFIDMIGYNTYRIKAGRGSGKLTKDQSPYSEYKLKYKTEMLFNFDDEGIQLITQNKWKRNVRELQKFVENIYSIFVDNKTSWTDQIIPIDDVRRAFIFHDKSKYITKEEQELLDNKYFIKNNNENNNDNKYSSYNDDPEKDPILKRLKLIMFSMRKNNVNVRLTNLKGIATVCKEINDSEELRMKYNLSKIERISSTNGNTISQFFEKYAKKIADLVDKIEFAIHNNENIFDVNEEALNDLFELKAYKNKVIPFRKANK